MRLTEKDIKLADEGYKALRGDKKTTRTQDGKTAAFKTVADRASIKKQSGKTRLILRKGTAEIPLPPQAVEVITKVLEQMAKGKEVTVTSKPDEMTTQQAADFLRVSRPFIVGLLEKGKIPFHKTGTHRRIRFDDLQAYKEKIDAQRLATLEELTKQAQELNMGY